MNRILLLMLLAGLSACSLRAPEVSDWSAQRDNVRALNDWQFRGRMAVNVVDDPDASH